MKRIILMVVVAFCLTITLQAQTALKKVYDEGINPLEQVEKAVKQAQVAGKHVVCQVGGNWCPWCLRFADFITKDSVINRMIADNYVYIHVNYNTRKKASESAQAQAKQLMKRLGNPGRFGFPVLVVLDGKGEVLHIQDSSFLESDESYDSDKVKRFFKNWTPKALTQ